MCELQGKVALVTGAGEGIGARTAEVLAEAGANVVVTGRTDGPCLEVVERIRSAGHEACFRHLDVGVEDDWRRVLDDVCASFGGLDVLVNNAGVLLIKPVTEITLQEWHDLARVNLDGVFLGTKHAIRAMTDGSTTRPRGGSIVNLSSVAGLVGVGFYSIYSMSKGGVRLFTKAVAAECAMLRNGVRVNSVHPGVIATPMAVEGIPGLMSVGYGRDADEINRVIVDKHPMGRLGTPDEVARAVLFLASDASSFVTGAELAVDGGFAAV
jgi:NAD(P)-dependent dehydrogenase (short-subunit alcohol dehydrogenase family)